MEYSRGTVFWTCGRILACATTLNRDVALKVLPDSVANDTDRFARSQREAQVLP